MRHYGIPDKFISMKKATYQGMPCGVVHGGIVRKARSDNWCPPRMSTNCTIPVSLSAGDRLDHENNN